MSHISSVHKKYVVSGYPIEQSRSRIFPSFQKALLDSPDLNSNPKF